ncbi:MAG: HlyD family efflux transporter periplasmic adaptor subunit [Spirochaetaceae bacterium]|nr:HlyD family efflux transporter periplasmic adaptor subunit [Spirochaetaceae bacterium]
MVRQKKLSKKLILIIVVVIVLILVFLMRFISKPELNENEPLIVTRFVSQNQIPISGYIQAARTQTLESPGEGIVESVPVKEGDVVKMNDVIFKLDDTEERYNLANQAYLMRQEEINASPRKLALMQEQYDMLKKKVDDKTVRAKFDGIIASLTVSEGEYALTKTNFGAIVDRSFLKATVEVTETDASKLQANQKVMLTFSSYEDEVEGFVVSYPSIARITDIGRTVVDTIIQVNNPPSSVLPGYSFDGYIIVGEPTDVLIVGAGAIRYVEGNPVVDKIVNGKTSVEVPVEIESYMLDGFVKIISGVEENDILVNHTTFDFDDGLQ